MVLTRARTATIWAALAIIILAPLIIAAANPLHASRNAAYVVASLAGVAALGLLALQPILAYGHLPGIARLQQRRWHHWIGAFLVLCVALHVGGLYLTSPPDTLDALLLVSPTPFSVYGVAAMWGIMISATLALSRRKLRLNLGLWRAVHTALAIVVVCATVIHALQIEGAMGQWSKRGLCAAALISLSSVLYIRYVRQR